MQNLSSAAVVIDALGGLTLKAPSIICSRRDCQTLLFFFQK